MTKQAVTDEVLGQVSRASGVPRSDLASGDTLKAMLGISHPQFVLLAQRLREFIRQNKPSQTLLLREIETAKATVGSVVDLVFQRVNS